VTFEALGTSDAAKAATIRSAEGVSEFWDREYSRRMKHLPEELMVIGEHTLDKLKREGLR